MIENQFFKQCIGIDVGESDLYASYSIRKEEVSTLKTSKVFKNTSSGITNLLKWISKECSKERAIYVVLEATGVYHELAAYEIYDKVPNVELHIAQPRNSKHHRESLGVREKNDKADGKNLSFYGLEKKLSKWTPPAKELAILRDLTRERGGLEKYKTSLNNQLHSLSRQVVVHESRKKRLVEQIRFLDNQIKSVTKDIAKYIRDNDEIKADIELLTSIPGIAELTAATVYAETNGFKNFTNAKQVAAFAGLDPSMEQSGKSKSKTKITKRGNRFIRRALYMPTMSAFVCNKPLKEFYIRLKENGHDWYSCATAGMRKLLLLMFSIIKSKKKYDPNYTWSAGVALEPKSSNELQNQDMAGQFEPKSEVSEEASILEMNTIDETVVDNIVNNIETSTFAESSKTDTGSAGVQPVRDGLVADGNVNLLKGA